MNGHAVFSFRRVAAITANTLTELTRQKIFYFILLFALLLIGTSGFLAPLSFQQEFQLLKDVALGAMSIFISLLAIASTARLLSQELEDRTIYTILAKPVSRFEYLLGKLAGVILLLALSLVFMSALFFAVLVFARTNRATRNRAADFRFASRANQRRAANRARLGIQRQPFAGDRDHLLQGLPARLAHAFRFNFRHLEYFHDRRHGIHLFHRTFAGHRASLLAATNSAGWLKHAFLGFVALVFPDLQAFNLVDDAVAGVAIPATLFLNTTLAWRVSTPTIYLLLAWSRILR